MRKMTLVLACLASLVLAFTTCKKDESTLNGNNESEPCWKFDEKDGTLYIWCIDMPDFVKGDTSTWHPWWKHDDSIKRVVIENTVTRIGQFAFWGCVNLVEVEFIEPSSVESIGENAFFLCKLSAIKIPNSVERIGNSAFNNCQRLHDVNLGEGVRIIGNSAFNQCVITYLTIPSSVEQIGEYAFFSTIGTNWQGQTGWNPLSSVSSLRPTPPIAHKTTFAGSNDLRAGSLCVKKEYLDSYGQAVGWKDGFTIIFTRL